MIASSRIAVFEDHEEQRDRYADAVRAMGMEPFRVDTPPPLSEIAAFLHDNRITGVISDHRLKEKHYSPYLGAELLETCYGLRIGAVLLTSYTHRDANTTLRLYRRWLPCVFDPDKLSNPALEIKAALERADAEARKGLVPAQREPFRAVMTVTRTELQGNLQMVKVLIGQWRPNTEVAFPFEMIPVEMRHHVKPNHLLIAQVNLDAENPDDLYFEKFELPDADAYRESQALPDHP
jgi:hypothetical protein